MRILSFLGLETPPYAVPHIHVANPAENVGGRYKISTVIFSAPFLRSVHVTINKQTRAYYSVCKLGHFLRSVYATIKYHAPSY